MISGPLRLSHTPMTVPCYYCDVAIPTKQAKRCGRCHLVTYCSKECQSLSWKSSHKVSCSTNSTLAALNGAKPVKFSMDWVQLEVDKVLSKWMTDWRRTLAQWTILALDLANHPLNRAITHCLHIIVEPRNFQTKSYKKCRVIHAAVVVFSLMQEHYPGLVTEIDSTDFTRFRYIVTLQSTEGLVIRVLLHQWNVRSLAFWGNLPKDGSAQLAEGVNRILISSMENTPPDVVEENLGLNR